MRKIFQVIIIFQLLSLSFSQDEFFQPGYTIGGYGEMHWNRDFDSNDNETKNQLDFHRFIIYYSYNFTEAWSFKSEVELEHNYLEGGEETGELELEQAFINYHDDNWGFPGGVILPSIGLLNEYHEPALFLSVERPLYNKYIIPTTWFGNGFAFYGEMFGIKGRIALLEDLNGEDIGYGIRNARGKGFKTTAFNWTKNISLSYTEFPGMKLGVSYTVNDAPIDDDKNNSVNVSIVEMHAVYDAHHFHSVFEYGNIDYDNNPAEINSSSGYYFDLGYDISSHIGFNGKLMPWFRLSNVSRADSIDSKIEEISKVGITWWPIDQIVFKLDYGKSNLKSDQDNTTTQFNLGIGYHF